MQASDSTHPSSSATPAVATSSSGSSSSSGRDGKTTNSNNAHRRQREQAKHVADAGSTTPSEARPQQSPPHNRHQRVPKALSSSSGPSRPQRAAALPLAPSPTQDNTDHSAAAAHTEQLETLTPSSSSSSSSSSPSTSLAASAASLSRSPKRQASSRAPHPPHSQLASTLAAERRPGSPSSAANAPINPPPAAATAVAPALSAVALNRRQKHPLPSAKAPSAATAATAAATIRSAGRQAASPRFPANSYLGRKASAASNQHNHSAPASPAAAAKPPGQRHGAQAPVRSQHPQHPREPVGARDSFPGVSAYSFEALNAVLAALSHAPAEDSPASESLLESLHSLHALLHLLATSLLHSPANGRLRSPPESIASQVPVLRSGFQRHGDLLFDCLFALVQSEPLFTSVRESAAVCLGLLCSIAPPALAEYRLQRLLAGLLPDASAPPSAPTHTDSPQGKDAPEQQALTPTEVSNHLLLLALVSSLSAALHPCSSLAARVDLQSVLPEWVPNHVNGRVAQLLPNSFASHCHLDPAALDALSQSSPMLTTALCEFLTNTSSVANAHTAILSLLLVVQHLGFVCSLDQLFDVLTAWMVDALLPLDSFMLFAAVVQWIQPFLDPVAQLPFLVNLLVQLQSELGAACTRLAGTVKNVVALQSPASLPLNLLLESPPRPKQHSFFARHTGTVSSFHTFLVRTDDDAAVVYRSALAQVRQVQACERAWLVVHLCCAATSIAHQAASPGQAPLYSMDSPILVDWMGAVRLFVTHLKTLSGIPGVSPLLDVGAAIADVVAGVYSAVYTFSSALANPACTLLLRLLVHTLAVPSLPPSELAAHLQDLGNFLEYLSGDYPVELLAGLLVSSPQPGSQGQKKDDGALLRFPELSTLRLHADPAVARAAVSVYTQLLSAGSLAGFRKVLGILREETAAVLGRLVNGSTPAAQIATAVSLVSSNNAILGQWVIRAPSATEPPSALLSGNSRREAARLVFEATLGEISALLKHISRDADASKTTSAAFYPSLLDSFATLASSCSRVLVADKTNDDVDATLLVLSHSLECVASCFSSCSKLPLPSGEDNGFVSTLLAWLSSTLSAWIGLVRRHPSTRSRSETEATRHVLVSSESLLSCLPLWTPGASAEESVLSLPAELQPFDFDVPPMAPSFLSLPQGAVGHASECIYALLTLLNMLGLALSAPTAKRLFAQLTLSFHQRAKSAVQLSFFSILSQLAPALCASTPGISSVSLPTAHMRLLRLIIKSAFSSVRGNSNNDTHTATATLPEVTLQPEHWRWVMTEAIISTDQASPPTANPGAASSVASVAVLSRRPGGAASSASPPSTLQGPTHGLLPDFTSPVLQEHRRIFRSCISSSSSSLARQDWQTWTALADFDALAVCFALWESARLAVHSRLNTPLGDPAQTFAVLERVIQDAASQIDSSGAGRAAHSILTASQLRPSPVESSAPLSRAYSLLGKSSSKAVQLGLLVQFVDYLEKHISNAVRGCLSLPSPSKNARLFFSANQGTCAEWLFNQRESLAALGRVAGTGSASSLFHLMCKIEALVAGVLGEIGAFASPGAPSSSASSRPGIDVVSSGAKAARLLCTLEDVLVETVPLLVEIGDANAIWGLSKYICAVLEPLRAKLVSQQQQRSKSQSSSSSSSAPAAKDRRLNDRQQRKKMTSLLLYLLSDYLSWLSAAATEASLQLEASFSMYSSLLELKVQKFLFLCEQAPVRVVAEEGAVPAPAVAQDAPLNEPLSLPGEFRKASVHFSDAAISDFHLFGLRHSSQSVWKFLSDRLAHLCAVLLTPTLSPQALRQFMDAQDTILQSASALISPDIIPSPSIHALSQTLSIRRELDCLTALQAMDDGDASPAAHLVETSSLFISAEPLPVSAVVDVSRLMLLQSLLLWSRPDRARDGSTASERQGYFSCIKSIVSVAALPLMLTAPGEAHPLTAQLRAAEVVEQVTESASRELDILPLLSDSLRSPLQSSFAVALVSLLSKGKPLVVPPASAAACFLVATKAARKSGNLALANGFLSKAAQLAPGLSDGSDLLRQLALEKTKLEFTRGEFHGAAALYRHSGAHPTGHFARQLTGSLLKDTRTGNAVLRQCGSEMRALLHHVESVGLLEGSAVLPATALLQTLGRLAVSLPAELAEDRKPPDLTNVAEIKDMSAVEFSKLVWSLYRASVLLAPSDSKNWFNFASWTYHSARKAYDRVLEGSLPLPMSSLRRLQLKQVVESRFSGLSLDLATVCERAEDALCATLPGTSSSSHGDAPWSVISARRREAVLGRLCAFLEDASRSAGLQLNAKENAAAIVDHMWTSLIADCLALFVRSLAASFVLLELDGTGEGRCAGSGEQLSLKQKNITLSLRILHLLVKGGDLLADTFETGLRSTPVKSWKAIIPQLLSRLSHSAEIVRSSVSSLLARLGQVDPNDVIFPVFVGHQQSLSQSAFAPSDASGLSDTSISDVRSVYSGILDSIRASHPRLVEEATALVVGLQHISKLWHEELLDVLMRVRNEALDRLAQVQDEVNRVLKNRMLADAEKKALIREKHTVIVRPVLSILERFAQRCFRAVPACLYEETLHALLKDEFEEALAALGEAKDPRDVPSSWAPMQKILDALQSASFQQRMSAMTLPALSNALGQFVGESLSMPGVDGVWLHGFAETITVLRSKTRPKRLCLVGTDGRQYVYLLKGSEDLHLDERIMQFLATVNSILAPRSATSPAELQFSARTYVVLPLGQSSGLIQWVKNSNSLYSIYKRFLERVIADEQLRQEQQQRIQAMTSNAPALRAAPVPKSVPSPRDLFWMKAGPILAAEGIDPASIPRSNWPADVLSQVYKSLCADTPSDILWKELWVSCAHLAEWWKHVKAFSRSNAVMAMVGYILGLGDRHLDNMLLDLGTGEIVHIDYNVCFEKGKALRLPETVPFRLSPNIQMALGVGGLYGEFRAGCELVLSKLRSNKETLLTLLEAFIYDPLVDWLPSSAASSKFHREMDVQTAITLLETRTQELRLQMNIVRLKLPDAIDKARLAVGRLARTVAAALEAAAKVDALKCDLKEAEQAHSALEHLLPVFQRQQSEHEAAQSAKASLMAQLDGCVGEVRFVVVEEQQRLATLSVRNARSMFGAMDRLATPALPSMGPSTLASPSSLLDSPFAHWLNATQTSSVFASVCHLAPSNAMRALSSHSSFVAFFTHLGLENFARQADQATADLRAALLHRHSVLSSLVAQLAPVVSSLSRLPHAHALHSPWTMFDRVLQLVLARKDAAGGSDDFRRGLAFAVEFLDRFATWRPAVGEPSPLLVDLVANWFPSTIAAFAAQIKRGSALKQQYEAQVSLVTLEQYWDESRHGFAAVSLKASVKCQCMALAFVLLDGIAQSTAVGSTLAGLNAGLPSAQSLLASQLPLRPPASSRDELMLDLATRPLLSEHLTPVVDDFVLEKCCGVAASILSLLEEGRIALAHAESSLLLEQKAVCSLLACVRGAAAKVSLFRDRVLPPLLEHLKMLSAPLSAFAPGVRAGKELEFVGVSESEHLPVRFLEQLLRTLVEASFSADSIAAAKAALHATYRVGDALRLDDASVDAVLQSPGAPLETLLEACLVFSRDLAGLVQEAHAALGQGDSFGLDEDALFVECLAACYTLQHDALLYASANSHFERAAFPVCPPHESAPPLATVSVSSTSALALVSAAPLVSVVLKALVRPVFDALPSLLRKLVQAACASLTNRERPDPAEPADSHAGIDGDKALVRSTWQALSLAGQVDEAQFQLCYTSLQSIVRESNRLAFAKLMEAKLDCFDIAMAQLEASASRVLWMSAQKLEALSVHSRAAADMLAWRGAFLQSLDNHFAQLSDADALLYRCNEKYIALENELFGRWREAAESLSSPADGLAQFHQAIEARRAAMGGDMRVVLELRRSLSSFLKLERGLDEFRSEETFRASGLVGFGQRLGTLLQSIADVETAVVKSKHGMGIAERKLRDLLPKMKLDSVSELSLAHALERVHALRAALQESSGSIAGQQEFDPLLGDVHAALKNVTMFYRRAFVEVTQQLFPLLTSVAHLAQDLLSEESRRPLQQAPGSPLMKQLPLVSLKVTSLQAAMQECISKFCDFVLPLTTGKAPELAGRLPALLQVDEGVYFNAELAMRPATEAVLVQLVSDVRNVVEEIDSLASLSVGHQAEDVDGLAQLNQAQAGGSPASNTGLGQEKNRFAVSVWRRVKAKLDGRDEGIMPTGATTATNAAVDARLSVSQQVAYAMAQALDGGNLSNMYEGWAPWF